MPHIVLYQPEIPPNTGNIGRLCLGAGVGLHLIKPLGFSLDAKTLLRAGLDYWQEVDVHVWENFTDLQEKAGSRARFFYFTTKATQAYWDAEYGEEDYLVFGPETRGLPEDLLKKNAAECFTIPMEESSVRSINLSNSVAIVLYEALRQNK